MAVSCSWESIDVHLLQVLHALLTECSVSNGHYPDVRHPRR